MKFLLFYSILLSLPLHGLAGSLRLILPQEIWAVVGQPTGLWFDNVVLNDAPDTLHFKVECSIGSSDSRRWLATPAATQSGVHPLRLTITNAEGKVLEQGSMMLNVLPAALPDTANARPLRLLVVGDSLTHASHYPNQLARLLALPGHPTVEFLGTHLPPNAKPGVPHEGYGGWTWQAFLTRVSTTAPAAGEKKKGTSPFLFPDASGKPTLQLKRYFDEKCSGRRPDVVTFLLGINDCFGANPDEPAALDAHIDRVLDDAEKLLAAFHRELPGSALAVGLTTPPNSRQEAFFANYQDKYTRWGWRRIQHRLVERMMQRLAGRESDGIYLLPTHLNLDPVDGYPKNNGVHPNEQGYAQIAASFHAWLQSWLTKRGSQR